MAGIYIHIPFCKQACSYCNFHFTTSSKNRDSIVKAIVTEIGRSKDYLAGEKIESIYLGGGTPSILSEDQLLWIFDGLNRTYDLSQLKEVTLEANPDDLSDDRLIALKKSPINRLSIGIQSFHQKDLELMNRAHSAGDGISALKRAQDHGFDQLTLDLIFGIPGSSNADWEENLNTFFELEVPHLSSYALTLEENTALDRWIEKGKVPMIDETAQAEQYKILQQFIDKNGWQQYELSNFSNSEENIAFHNSAYWSNQAYLGIGPSAHSYNGKSRQWNIANNALYLKKINQGDAYFEKEELKEEDRYHETLISRLRTKWGMDKAAFRANFSERVQAHFDQSKTTVAAYLEEDESRIKIKRKYWFTSDNILEKLML